MEQLPGHTYNFKTLANVYISLLFLAGLMVGFSLLPMSSIPITWIDLHVLKTLIIFTIGTTMALIIAGFLMGLKYESSKLNAIIFFTNFAFLFIFILFTWTDLGLRGAMDPSFMKQINWDSPVTKENAREQAQEAPAPAP